MRVTPGIISGQVAADLQAALAALARQQAHVSSGRRIMAPSDDPGAAAQALIVRSRESANEQFRKTIAAARSSLAAADSILGGVRETVTRAKELAIQGANDTNDALARQSLGGEVNQLLESLVSAANSRGTRGEFIFGGQESTVAPYTVTRDSTGRITAVTPNARGIDGTTPAEVSEAVTVPTGVSGTSIFGAATDATYAFDVLIRLRDNLNGTRGLTLEADVTATGAANANKYLGIDSAADLGIGGPTGSAFVGLTVAGDDALSYSGNATSAIATAAKINAQTAATGVTATATKAQITYRSGSFANDITLDGTGGKKLVINGQSITGAVAGGSATARRDALVALINGASGATGVVASAMPATDDFVLTAADGRNISLETDATVASASVNGNFFGFATGLTATGAATSVVARGGVRLTASGPITTDVAAGAQLADQVGGEGTTGIQAALDELVAVLDRATTPSTLVGARLGWLDQLDQRLGDESIGLASTRSRIEDLDYAKAVQDLKQIQTFYEAALVSGARLLQQSLLAFLK